MNFFSQIEAYIDGALVGEELTDFKNALKVNETLRKEVELHQEMIKGIQAKEADRLRKMFGMMDPMLDEQLKQEDKNKIKHLQMELRSDAHNPEIIRLPLYKSPFFRVAAAAAVVLVFAAYFVFPPKGKTQMAQSTPLIKDIAYTGWGKQINLEDPTPLPNHASKGDIQSNDFDDQEILNKPKNFENPESAPKEKGDAVPTASKPASKKYEYKNPQVGSDYDDADFYFGQKNYDGAIEVLQQIEDEDLFRKHFRLGVTYYFKGDLDNATRNLKKALGQPNIDTNEIDFYAAKWHLGMTYMKQKNQKAAKAYFVELAKNTNTNVYVKEAKKALKAVK